MDKATGPLEVTRCSTCSKLNYDFFKTRYSFREVFSPTFFSIGSFERIYTSSESCPLCRVIYCHLVYQATTRPLLQWMIYSVSDIGLHLSEDEELLVNCFTEEGILKLCDIRSDVIPVFDGEQNARELKEPLLNPSCDSDGSLIFSWLAACERSHDRCRADIAGAPPLPTRVIDVGARADSGGSLCCLILTEGRHADYITLSHCWGGRHDSNSVLTLHSMPSLLAGFSDAALPKTFKDAVWITRQLGKRYLWIDSLCIIQPTAEDNSDWTIEGSKMSDIYRNSWLTIAASSASNSLGGCLFGRLGSEFEIGPAPLFERAIRRDWEGAQNYFDRNPDWLPTVRPNPPSWVNIVQKSPLGSRAWVLQERILSRRTLYASVQGFFWECAEKRASVYEPLGCSFDYMFRDSGIQTINQLLAEEQQPESLLGFHWRRIVEYYTRLRLTFESDRLPAIAGLAKPLGIHTGDTYLVGHWETTLCSSLLWFRLADEEGVEVRPAEGGLPSWSWAAMPGAVKFTSLDSRDYPTRQMKNYQMVATITSYTRLDSRVPQHTTLKVTGRHRLVELGQTDLRILTIRKTISDFWAGHIPTSADIGQLGAVLTKPYEDEFCDDKMSVGIVYDAEERKSHEGLVLFQILSASRNDLAAAEARHEGLVLRRRGSAKGFERIGFFTSQSWGLFDGTEPETVELF